MFTRLHFVRLVFVLEDALEFALPLPDQEWLLELDRERIVAMLMGSARVVPEAVFGRLERWMELHGDHRMLFLQPMNWQEGYHHGQIRLALGCEAFGGTRTVGLAVDTFSKPVLFRVSAPIGYSCEKNHDYSEIVKK